MIILVCGPSGGGKSTLLREVNQRASIKLIDVAVCRDLPRNDGDLGKHNLSKAEWSRLCSGFQYVYEYDGTLYGYSLCNDDIVSDDYVFLDYPGEYPSCVELNYLNWHGIIVLPPSKTVLCERLSWVNRLGRMASSLLEYDVCLGELKRGVYNSKQWRVYFSGDMQSLRRIVNIIVTKTLF